MALLERLAGLFRGRRDEVRVAGGTASAAGVTSPPRVEDLPGTTPAQRIVRQICEEALENRTGWRARLSDSARWKTLKHDPPELQIAVMQAAIDARRKDSALYRANAWQIDGLRKSIVSQLARRGLPFGDELLVRLLEVWRRQPYGLEYGFPGLAVLGAVERHAKAVALSGSLRTALERLHARASVKGLLGTPPNRFSQGVARRAARLLNPSLRQVTGLPAGPFGERFQSLLATLAEDERARWSALALQAVDAGDKPKPTRKWLEAITLRAHAIEAAQFTAQLSRLLDETTPDPARPDQSLDILKGLIWASTVFDHAELAGQLSRFTETCFRKVSGVGPRSAKLGNAALWALSEMGGEPRAAAELFRLRGKIKRPSTQKVIDNRLAELAQKTGRRVEDLEDLSLPDFGLGPEGTASVSFANARAELAVQADGLRVRWFNAAGRRLQSVPAEVRAEHKDALATFRQRVKDIDDVRAMVVQRLEESWLEGRGWTFAEWRTHFLDHPLRRPIADALIWRIGDTEVLPSEGAPSRFAEDAPVSLWHPLASHPEAVLAWRRRIVDLGVTQPIKQAHREVYVLTDAERRTNIYSNRFAAHILRQHQFRALCQARGWRYDLMGGWGSWSLPTRALPGHGLSVEYQVETVDDGRHSAAGVSLHLATDQVRFVDVRKRPVELEAVPRIVFSEALRDVDLFVAVTSVANDPAWTDGGPDGRHGAYWREWAFGDLGETATARRELISWIVPRLSIADKLKVADKFLIVQGKRHEYAIHLGSSNIQIRPFNRYLCIVPDRPPTEATALRLPFAGDGMLSTILAKAFLLVDESKIRDETILRQL